MRKVRQGQLLAISGMADRHVALETDPPFQRSWFATSRAHGPLILAELNYDRCHVYVKLGLRSVIRCGEDHWNLQDAVFNRTSPFRLRQTEFR